MTPEEEKDLQRRIFAELALQSQKDQAQDIHAKEREAQVILQPIRSRRAYNHYLEEAKALMESRLKR